MSQQSKQTQAARHQYIRLARAALALYGQRAALAAGVHSPSPSSAHQTRVQPHATFVRSVTVVRPAPSPHRQGPGTSQVAAVAAVAFAAARAAAGGSQQRTARL